MASHTFQPSHSTYAQLPQNYNQIIDDGHSQSLPTNYTNALSPSTDYYRVAYLHIPIHNRQEPFQGYPDLPHPPISFRQGQSTYGQPAASSSRRRTRDSSRPYPQPIYADEWPDLPPPPPQVTSLQRLAQSKFTDPVATNEHTLLAYSASNVSAIPSASHWSGQEPSLSPTDERTFCSQSHYGNLSSSPTSSRVPLFGSGQALHPQRAHVFTANQQVALARSPVPQSPNDHERPACPDCRKPFKRNADLLRHQRSSCPKKGARLRLPCDNHIYGCTETFARKDTIRKHLDKGHCHHMQPP